MLALLDLGSVLQVQPPHVPGLGHPPRGHLNPCPSGDITTAWKKHNNYAAERRAQKKGQSSTPFHYRRPPAPTVHNLHSILSTLAGHTEQTVGATRTDSTGFRRTSTEPTEHTGLVQATEPWSLIRQSCWFCILADDGIHTWAVAQTARTGATAHVLVLECWATPFVLLLLLTYCSRRQLRPDRRQGSNDSTNSVPNLEAKTQLFT